MSKAGHVPGVAGVVSCPSDGAWARVAGYPGTPLKMLPGVVRLHVELKRKGWGCVGAVPIPGVQALLHHV